MKKFRKSRDDGTFALTTLQNPTLEVRNLCQLVAAAQQIVAEDACPPPQPAVPDAPPSNDAPPPEAEQPSPEELAAESAPPQTAAPAPQTPLGPAEPPPPQPRTRQHTPRRKPAPSSRKKAASPKPRRRAPRREITALERHQRKCVICQHPNHDAIDSYFVHWYPPHRIANEFGIAEVRYIYRHAHATGLMTLRRRYMRDSLEYIVERAYTVDPTADAVIRAARACSRINAEGEWVDPPTRVIFSSEVQRRSADGRIAPGLPAGLPQLPPAIDLQPAISNRHTSRLENAATHSKQTTACSSNRHFLTGFTRKILAFLRA